ncbi:hypothetical protein B7C62_28175 [Kitasatospora albolonga]|uniref:Uncharacterized protein n=1 Tax=Kitasatospora albolonga TaxID=68173 RepID=A0ABC8BZU0_9ACTN|nr:hypothetical protein B7C62_28175 [Kitasatospora albolonga]
MLHGREGDFLLAGDGLGVGGGGGSAGPAAGAAGADGADTAGPPRLGTETPPADSAHDGGHDSALQSTDSNPSVASANRSRLSTARRSSTSHSRIENPQARQGRRRLIGSH